MNAPGPVPDLTGLVLAGGQSSRMGEDKASLDWCGTPLAAHCQNLLAEVCADVLISIRADQAQSELYRGKRQILDAPGVEGPAAGLLAAWEGQPDAALLVLAVDLPLVDTESLEFLASNRDPARLATVFRHPNGILEPLCAIWEPAAAARLREAAEVNGAPSLRRILEEGPIVALEPPEPARIVSCNTPEAYAAAQNSFLTR